MIRSPLRLSRRSALSLAAALPLAMAAAPSRAQSGPIAITDALGRAITLKAPAERIVLGFNFEEFTAVAGAAGWDRVVGFSRTQWAVNHSTIYKRYAAAIPRLVAMPDVGTTEDNSFSLEKVLSLRPDLVVVAEWSFAVLGSQVQQLEALGIPVLVLDYNAEIPERHVASTVALGRATGNEERARTLASLYLAKIADIARRVEGVATRPKVYLELGMGGADVVGNTYWKGMWGRLLDRVAVENIAAGRIPGAYAPLSPEYVLSANPDAIFIAGSSWTGQPKAVLTGFDADPATTRARLAPYARRQGWADLAAIRNGQLHALEHGLCRALFDYCPTYFIAKALHPERFADIDPIGELRRYHEQFLPVTFEGTWMTRLEPAPS